MSRLKDKLIDRDLAAVGARCVDGGWRYSALVMVQLVKLRLVLTRSGHAVSLAKPVCQACTSGR